MSQVQLSQTQAEEALGFELPTRRVEAFHYTDLKSLIRELPEAASDVGDQTDDYARLVDAVRLPFVDGQYVADLADILPEGVLVSSGAQKASSTNQDDALIAMNAALKGDAIEIVIKGDSTSDKPLGLAHVAKSAGSSACYHKVTVKKGSDAAIIDRYVSDDGVAHFSSSVCELKVEEGAKVNWFILQEDGVDATRMARLNVALEKGADLAIWVLNAGGKLVRQEIKIDVDGEDSNLAIRGVNLVAGSSHIDVTTILSHNVPNTNAEELFRNVVFDKGHGVFQGQIKVAQIAQKTDAQMACNTLLMSDDANFSAKPELEIFADDVICAHGATVADIEAEHLFYLRARGISEKNARALLVKGFLLEAFDALENEALLEALSGIVSDWLDQNG